MIAQSLHTSHRCDKFTIADNGSLSLSLCAQQANRYLVKGGVNCELDL